MADYTFKPVFTDVGRAAVAAADGVGLNAKITHIALGASPWDARANDGSATAAALEATALQNEVVRTTLTVGGSLAPNQVAMQATFNPADPGNSDPTFWITEIGFFLEDGTLLAVAARSSPDGFGYRGDVAPWTFNFVLSWSDLPSDSITVIFDGDAAMANAFLQQLKLVAQMRALVEGAGLVWDPDDTAQISTAIGLLADDGTQKVLQPFLSQPPNGSINVGETPTIRGSAFWDMYSAGHAHSSVEISTDVNFTAIVWSGIVNSGDKTQAVLPAATLSTDTTYFARMRYTDNLSNTSAWSLPTSFSTGATFVEVAQPVNATPANGATGVSLVPTLSASAFAVNGGADTHVASQWVIDQFVGPGIFDWQNAVWDSGEVADLQSVTPAFSFDPETKYRFKVRYKGNDYGWSSYSAETEFTTSVPAGSTTYTVAGGIAFIVPPGVYSIRESWIGGGGDGGPSAGGVSESSGGSGGGGGRRTRAVVPGHVITGIVGAGGINSAPGGTTSIDGQVSATGGGPGAVGADAGPPGIGLGGDINGQGGQGRISGAGDATTIGGGGGSSPGQGVGQGALGGGPGNASGPGGGGQGCDLNGFGKSAGADGMIRFEWGPGI